MARAKVMCGVSCKEKEHNWICTRCGSETKQQIRVEWPYQDSNKCPECWERNELGWMQKSSDCDKETMQALREHHGKKRMVRGFLSNFLKPQTIYNYEIEEEIERMVDESIEKEHQDD